jgi:dienelactone hydrolase
MNPMKHIFVTSLVLLPALLVVAVLCLGTPAQAASLPKGAEAVRLTSSDQHDIAAWYFKPAKEKSPALILLHMRGSDKSSFASLATKLHTEGFAVISIDLRGHGDSQFPDGSRPDFKDLQNGDYLAMLNDVRAAHDFLAGKPAVDAERVGIIGASIGANLAIMYAATDRRVRTVVALSAGLDYKGLIPADYLEDFGTRPLYLLCARDDEYAWQSSVELEKLARLADPVSLRVLAGQAHGTDLLISQPGLEDTICSGWLLNYLPPKR